MPTPVSRLKADLLLLAVSFIWGSAFIAQSIAGKAGLAFLYNGACFTLAGLVLLPLALRAKLAPGQLRWMAVAGLLLFGGSAFQQYGLYYTKVANAGFLTVTNVVFVPLLLLLFFGDKPKLAEWLAVAMAITGAFLLSTGGEKLVWQPGDIMEIIGAVFWALHVILIAKIGGRYESIPFAAGQLLLCGVLNFAVGFATESPAGLFEQNMVAAILYRGLLSIGIGYTMQVWVQKFTPPTDAVLIFSMESVFAALCAWLLLSEGLHTLQIVGCGLILVAAFFPQLVRGGSAH